ncbi:MAG: hypothetical protein JW789_00875 [Candidatus Aenigmarchaeota archaeon]|nr:hypothetical protein [Candidatus Aenigmarchaeota archaeon]
MSFIINENPDFYTKSIESHDAGNYIERLGFLEHGIIIEDRKGGRMLFTDSDGYNTKISEWDITDMEKYSRKFGYPVEELKEIRILFRELVSSFDA